MKHQTTVAQPSDHERVITRTFDANVNHVFAAWTQPALFRRWWVPSSFPISLLACEMDVREGGGYRLTFGNETMPPMDFFGRYLEVVPNARLVWTNEEGGVDTHTTTVTFAEHGAHTTVTITERYPTHEALVADGAHEAAAETHAQLDALLASL